MSHSLDQIPRLRLLTDQEVLNAVILEKAWVPQTHESLAVTVVNALPVSVGAIEIGAVNILNAADVTINPATEETLQSILSVVSNPTGEPTNVYGEVTAVASGVPTTVVSYVVPATKTFFLVHASASGNNVATFQVEINGVKQAFKRSYFTEFNADFSFEVGNGQGLKAVAGDVVRVRGKHVRPTSADFEANLFGRLV